MKKCSKLPAALPAKPSKPIIIRTFPFFAMLLLLVTILPGKLFAAAPAIASFSPATGSVGTLLTINGTNLSNPTALTIGGRSAIVISNTGSALVAMVMPGTGAGKVSITTTGGTATSSSSFTVTATPFPSAPQGSELVGTGNTGAAQQGQSVALSADGNTAIVGGPADNSGQGAAWVYTRSGGAWTQQGPKLVGTNGSSQGQGVSINADGNTAIVGGGAGACVYTRSGGAWAQQGPALAGGILVCVSADGNTAIAGGAGGVNVYTRSSGAWAQQGPALAGGNSAFLSADGNTVIVGVSGGTTSTGGAFVYTRSGGIWAQQGPELVGTGGSSAAQQGISVSLSADGNTAIVGGPFDGAVVGLFLGAPYVGAAWVYTRSGGTWTQQGTKLVGTTTADPRSGNGGSVSLSADGNTALIGGKDDDIIIWRANIYQTKGAAWVFTRSGGAWTQKGPKLVGNGRTQIAQQGKSVSLSADGSTAMIGGPKDGSVGTGGASITNLQGAAWAFIALSANASLSTITLTPAFTLTNTGTVGSTTTYTTAVGANTSSVTVTPTTQDPKATVTVNGIAVASGTASGPIPLPEGANTAINTIVTAQDGITTRTYSIIATRPPSTNTSLRIIALTPASTLVNTGTVGTTVSYTTTAGANTSSVTVTPTAVDPTATITVNGMPVATGTASGPIPLPEGANTTINTVVTSPDGTTTKTYSIIVTRPPSTNTSLSIIALTPASTLVNTGTSGNTVTYTTSVSNATASVTVTPTAVDPTATITVNGIPVATATASGPIALAEGTTTTINTVVTSPDGTTTKTYSITVTRAPSPNALLTSIALTPASTLINAGTSGSTTTYTTTVANATASVTVTPTSQDPNATITVNGGAVTSGTASGPVDLTEGANTTIDVVVTAQDGTTTRSYTLIIARAPSANASLSTIILSPSSTLINTGTVGSTTTYTTSVSTDFASVTVTPTAQNADAIIKVNDVPVMSGTASGDIALGAEGTSTIINTVVTSQDGTVTHTYSIIINHAASANAVLSAIALTPASILVNTGTVGSTTTYTTSVSNATTSVTVTPTSQDANSTVAVNGIAVLSGNSSGPIALNAGQNIINTVVTAQDGTTTRTYSIIVARANALDNLGLTGSTLAAGAYSLRLLSSGYTGPLARITIGTNYYDVYPDASAGKIFSLSSRISAAYTSYNAPVTAATANLLSSIIAGKLATVAIWYDQSGIGDDAIQGTTSIQPEIINGGTIDVTNALPAIKFLGANYLVVTTIAFNNDLSGSVVFNATNANTTSGTPDVWYNMNGIFGAEEPLQVFDFGYGIFNNVFTAGNGPADNSVGGATVADDGTTRVNSWTRSNSSGAIALYASGAADGSAVLNSGSRISVPSVAIGAITTTGGGIFNGTMSEITVFPSVYTAAQRQTIEANQETYYGIKPAIASLTSIALTPASALINTGTVGNTTTYTTSVGNAVTSVTVTPTTQDPNATVKVNGIAVTSGSVSQSIALAVGQTIITTVVTAQDGITTATYKIIVGRGASNASLSTIALTPYSSLTNEGTVGSTTTYTTSVSNGVASVTVTPTAVDLNASVAVNGITVISGTASGSIALAVGTNTINTVVTAQDGVTTETYSIVVTRAASSNASLGTIALTPASALTNGGTAGSTTTYTATVGAATSSVRVIPTTQDPNATITVNGVAVASGTASAPVPLPEGANTTINTVVTAPDGITTRTYSIIVTRPSSTNTSLRIIALTPASALVNTGTVGTTVTYTTLAGANTSSVTVTPTAVDPTATITVNGIPVATGTASRPVSLPEGANTTITTVVTSADWTTTRTYLIIVTRPPSTNTSLSIIALTPASTLVNTGTVGTTVTYTTSVSNTVASVTVTPTAVDPNATITVNGIPVATTTASGPIALAEGTTTTINTVVTSPDGTTTKTYSITVTRAPSSNASLSTIALTPASTLINAGTSGSTTTYTTTAANVTASVTVTPVTQDPNATITVNGAAVTSGTASGPVALTEGTNTTITTVVTAQDGTTTNTYTIIVTRAPSGNAALNAIVLSPFSLLTNTGTVGSTTTYTTSVSNAIASVTVTSTSVDPNTTITVNGTAVPSATASGSIALAAGATTTIHIVVRAQDGTTTRTYAIVVTRLNPNTLDNLGLTSSTPAAGAYSLRVLSSSYNRPLVRVTIGTNYYDVYPDASKAKTFSLSSPISAAYTGYNAPVTAATTNLLSSIIAGNTATVAIWYDQSGNNYDAIQSDPGTQPEIASGGTIDVTNALPTIKFLGANYLVVTSTAFNNDLSGSVVFNATNANNISGTPDFWHSMNGIFGSEQPYGVNDFGYGILNNKFTAGNGPIDNSVGGATVVDDGTTRINSWTRTNSSGAMTLYAAGRNDGSATLNSGSRDAVPSVAIGAITTTGGGDFNGTLSELTVFPTVYTLAQRQTIEGNQETYYGAAPAINALLAIIALTPTSQLLNAGTSGSTTTYTTSVGSATASVTVTPVTQDPEATVTVNGIAVTSGTASGPIALVAGADVTINTIVTARDGITKRTYVIIVTRVPSSNASLTSIKLTPASSLVNTGTVGGTTTYTTSVSNSTASVTVTPAAQDAGATIMVNGVLVASGAASGSIALTVGQTTINTVVTAQDGTTTHTYSITVTRLSNNALLSTIKLTPASILTNTGTTGSTTTYTTSVSNATISVTVTPTAQDPAATVTVNSTAVTSGTASGSISLAVGQTAITTVVTSPDGTTTHTYSITVTRATGPLKNLYMPVSVVQPTDNLSIENDGVMVHQGVSPNGDGINDFLTIDGIIAYPVNRVTIIDRSGAVIFEAKGYNNISKVFDGHSGNGRMLQPGTYFYSLDYIADGQNKHKTGFILLKY